MTLQALIDTDLFQIIHTGDQRNRPITTPYCCDRLSLAMNRAPEGCVFVTVVANINTLAVASMRRVACILFSEGQMPDRETLEKAKKEGITILGTDLPSFDASLLIYERLHL